MQNLPILTDVTLRCDFPNTLDLESQALILTVETSFICPNPPTQHFKATFGTFTFHADYCSEHRQPIVAALSALGLTPAAAIVGRKPRGVHIAASGVPFSSNEARQWLIEEGVLENGSRAGRISNEHLSMYAKAH